MKLEKTIDIIIQQERKEIKIYKIFAFLVIVAFSFLLCFNLVSGYIKDIAAAVTNFLTLAVGYIPFQQIMKRQKEYNILTELLDMVCRMVDRTRRPFRK